MDLVCKDRMVSGLILCGEIPWINPFSTPEMACRLCLPYRQCFALCSQDKHKVSFARVGTTHAKCIGRLRQAVNLCAIETRFDKLRKFISRLSKKIRAVQDNATHSFSRCRNMPGRSAHVGWHN
ncbi:hypothetical protein HBI09_001370 [Parastagonospora nodorum]|nr:hypothetical protein HBI09_001370 [Parastagonospora nodorum]KAH5027139.1 hypothetical protein HBI77_001360 [Parastagonospora nodorum]